MGRFWLAGLAGVGAVILLFIGWFSDPITTLGNSHSAFADAQALALQPALTFSSAEIEQAAVNIADLHRQGDAIGVQLAQNQKELAQANQELAQQTIELEAAQTEIDKLRQSIDELGRQRRADARHQQWQHGRRGPVSAHVAQSHRGTWLFPPNPNGGGN
jgi:septal ring factor EnvC (AmiA/AmiB activator)